MIYVDVCFFFACEMRLLCTLFNLLALINLWAERERFDCVCPQWLRLTLHGIHKMQPTLHENAVDSLKLYIRYVSVFLGVFFIIKCHIYNAERAQTHQTQSMCTINFGRMRKKCHYGMRSIWWSCLRMLEIK